MDDGSQFISSCIAYEDDKEIFQPIMILVYNLL